MAPGAEGEIANADAWNEHDVEFVVSMVPHHTQALRMAELAPERASDPRVEAVAERILSVQGGEVEQLQTWLTTHGLPEADPRGHGPRRDAGDGRGAPSCSRSPRPRARSSTGCSSS